MVCIYYKVCRWFFISRSTASCSRSILIFTGAAFCTTVGGWDPAQVEAEDSSPYLPFYSPSRRSYLFDSFCPSTVEPWIPLAPLIPWNQATAQHNTCFTIQFDVGDFSYVLLFQEFPSYWRIAVSSSVACYNTTTIITTPPSTHTDGWRIPYGLGWGGVSGGGGNTASHRYEYHVIIANFVYKIYVWIYSYHLMFLDYAPNVEWHPLKVWYPHVTRVHNMWIYVIHVYMV